jgi:hypothetical protein
MECICGISPPASATGRRSKYCSPECRLEARRRQRQMKLLIGRAFSEGDLERVDHLRAHTKAYLEQWDRVYRTRKQRERDGLESEVDRMNRFMEEMQ